MEIEEDPLETEEEAPQVTILPVLGVAPLAEGSNDAVEPPLGISENGNSFTQTTRPSRAPGNLRPPLLISFTKKAKKERKSSRSVQHRPGTP